ncbi:twin-arginine translocase TatA/TatE family subunit [Streptomyces sp. WMMB 322]|uniref:twin-arginine translocase TatA/TatE family subunit n=1 Tax=Streptomyces sp. WMMB 322 TaxID=1286821 RepID=UPI0006E38FEA|nr:twin-arginine translocase TatA/TatE family subunit [Streptomyces sp. WMMB 322]SCK15675.1 sec-independent protein translocase protein TatA [Streptomyces sp. WMMB 322]
MFGISEVALLILVAVVVFGARKLPELARSLGKSARILKSEAKALKTDRSASGAGSASYIVHPPPEKGTAGADGHKGTPGPNES